MTARSGVFWFLRLVIAARSGCVAFWSVFLQRGLMSGYDYGVGVHLREGLLDGRDDIEGIVFRLTKIRIRRSASNLVCSDN